MWESAGKTTLSRALNSYRKENQRVYIHVEYVIHVGTF